MERKRRKKKSFGQVLLRLMLIGAAVVVLVGGGYYGIKKLILSQEHQFNVTKILIPKKGMLDQGSARTCWAYTGLAMIEAELLRTGKGEFDLSEGYITYYNSLDRCQYSINNPDEKWNLGGCLADVWETIKKHGIVPDSLMRYPDDRKYNLLRTEISGDDGLVAQAGWAVGKDDKEGEKMCKTNIQVAHNRCFNEPPAMIAINGDSVTPQQYWESMGLDINDYIQVTSVTGVPYGKECVMTYPDHWRKVPTLNVELDKMMELVDKSIEMGYTVAWDGDISDRTFAWHFQNGFARLFGKKERWVSPSVRQKAIDKKKTWDDHTMLICGTAVDENGDVYYVMKNSWGKLLPNGGMLMMSRAYLRYKTIMLTFHKDVLK